MCIETLAKDGGRKSMGLVASVVVLLFVIVVVVFVVVVVIFWRGEGDFLPYFASSKMHP